MKPLCTLILPVLLGLVSLSATSQAQNVDSLDFRTQGEYSGRVRDWQGYVGRLGMQVVAQGNQQFMAVVYQGGLPVDGWNGSPRIRFSGKAEGDKVVLHQDKGGARLEFVDQGDGFWYLYDARDRMVAGMLGVHRQSPTMGRPAPSDAQVRFDGDEPIGLEGAKVNPLGHLGVGFMTAQGVRDFELHVEFRTPFEPTKEGQGRGNSGVYIQRRYEVQILDSFGLEGLPNQCGGLYRQRAPDLNMCLPPMSWQTYDIQFQAARFDDQGNKTVPAQITVWHNGHKIHDDVKIPTKTGAGQPEGPNPLPILFQDHSNPVEFRNLWITPR